MSNTPFMSFKNPDDNERLGLVGKPLTKAHTQIKEDEEEIDKTAQEHKLQQTSTFLIKSTETRKYLKGNT